MQKLTLQVPDDAAEINPSGIATKFLLDVQRFLACKKIVLQENLIASHLGSAFKTLVGHAKCFSSRTNLLFRSNARLRTDLQMKLMIHCHWPGLWIGLAVQT